jgi:uncharacterized membrane protein
LPVAPRQPAGAIQATGVFAFLTQRNAPEFHGVLGSSMPEEAPTMIAIQHIHPMIVHFPIVFFLTLAGVDIIALLRGDSVTARSAWGFVSTSLAVLAAVSAIVAWIFGDMALEFAEAGGFSSDIAETHEGLGTTTAIAFAVWALLRL